MKSWKSVNSLSAKDISTLGELTRVVLWMAGATIRMARTLRKITRLLNDVRTQDDADTDEEVV